MDIKDELVENEGFTEDEINEIREECKDLRKISILEKLPLYEWTKEELIDLIYEYDLSMYGRSLFDNKKILSVYEYVYNGHFKRVLEYMEEYKKENNNE